MAFPDENYLVEPIVSRITILSEHLANQIAAGEVVERPASVVKELLENSIDAGADQIDIEVEGDGTRRILIVDNGEGMDGDDVLLCLERHATSKLAGGDNDAARLTSISTLGFRGEAIPSIASVSKMTITSKTEKSPLGTRVDISYGKITAVHETGASRGTIVEVRTLFGNLPARKKFLKSRRTELGHIEEVIRNCCLAYPRLGLTYAVDGRIVLDLPAQTDSGESRFRRILDRKSGAPLIAISGVDGQNSRTLSGWLLPPDEPEGTAGRLRFFVNGRAIRDRMLTHAVHEGLATFVMKGRSAGGVLFIDLPPETVDINVHPTKQEIRFRDPQELHALVSGTVKKALAAHQDQLRFSLFGRPERSAVAAQVKNIPDSAPPRPSQTVIPNAAIAVPAREPAVCYAPPPPSSSGHSRPADEDAHPHPEPTALTPIGQLHNLYILCQSSDGLVVIDQHAAHERIHFEALKEQFSQNRLAAQALLFPVIIDLTPDEHATLLTHHDQFQRLGFQVEEFGGDSVVIKAAPAPLAHVPAEEMLREMLAHFQGASHRPQDGTRIDAILSSMACRVAVKAGHHLSPEEIRELLAQMSGGSVFSHCPHGRPAFKSLSLSDIEKWFHRG